jgi:hypothetical protein
MHRAFNLRKVEEQCQKETQAKYFLGFEYEELAHRELGQRIQNKIKRKCEGTGAWRDRINLSVLPTITEYQVRGTG